MAPDPAPLTVSFGGRTLKVSSLDKVLYPSTGMTKGEVIDYYVRVADAMLRQLRGRPVTRVRFPHGVGAPSFFEKNAPAGTPDWIPVLAMPADGVFGSPSTIVRWPMIGEIAALVWAVNLGGIELHTPQWRVGFKPPADGAGTEPGAAPRPMNPDRLVIDLDPGPGCGLVECAAIALAIRERLAGLGVSARPVTSGSKGLHLYADLPGDFDAATTSAIARDLAKAVAVRFPKLVVWEMAKDKRKGKVFVDWSQNASAKTTVTPYSLRGRDQPTVAAPRTWREIEETETVDLQQLGPAEVLARLESLGDLLDGDEPDST